MYHEVTATTGHRASPLDGPFLARNWKKAHPKKRPDGIKLVRYYQALLDSGKFESRAALVRHLGVSRARVMQVLRRLKTAEQ